MEIPSITVWSNDVDSSWAFLLVVLLLALSCGASFILPFSFFSCFFLLCCSSDFLSLLLLLGLRGNGATVSIDDCCVFLCWFDSFAQTSQKIRENRGKRNGTVL